MGLRNHDDLPYGQIELSDEIRVCIIHPALAPYRVDLFNALALEFDLQVIFLDTNVSYQNYDQNRLLSRLSAGYKFVNRTIEVCDRKLPIGLLQVLEEVEPDIIITHEFSPTTARIAISKLARSVGHIVWTTDNPLVVERESRIRRLARKVLLKQADGLIVYADETKNLYRHRFKFSKPIGVCPNIQSEATLRSHFQSSSEIASQKLLDHGLDGTKIILKVGRLAKSKRHDRLLHAFAIAQRSQKNIKLVLVGDGPVRREVEYLAADLGIAHSVIFTGHIEGQDLYSWFDIGSVFVLTSEFEPWGAVVNEALSAGMPVICSDQAGARVLIQSGKNGAVVSAHKIREVAREIVEWCDKVPATTCESIRRGRCSLMMQTFDEAVSGFVGVVTTVFRRQFLSNDYLDD